LLTPYAQRSQRKLGTPLSAGIFERFRLEMAVDAVLLPEGNISKPSRAGEVGSEERTRTQCTASTAGANFAHAAGFKKFPEIAL
jgi:hypothetical protein